MRRRTLAGACIAAALPWRVLALPAGAADAEAADADADAADRADRRAWRLERWQRLVDDAREAGAEACIGVVDAAVNRLIADAPDPDLRRWPTPLEALARGSGDCRSFAVLKFFALLAAAPPGHDVRLLYALQQRPETPGLQRPHLVAWVRAGTAVPRVLDNLAPFPLPLAQRPDLRVVFSIDREHLRRADSDIVDRPAAALRPWQELLERLQRQGGAGLASAAPRRPASRPAHGRSEAAG